MLSYEIALDLHADLWVKTLQFSANINATGFSSEWEILYKLHYL